MSKLKPSGPTIFTLLENLQKKNGAFYRDMKPEHKKLFHPYVAMRWLASGGDQQLLMLNEFANKIVFSLDGTHTELKFDVLAACTSGRRTRLNWTKTRSSSSNSSKFRQAVRAVYGEHISDDDCLRVSEDELVGICEALGYDEKETRIVVEDYTQYQA